MLSPPSFAITFGHVGKVFDRGFPVLEHLVSSCLHRGRHPTVHQSDRGRSIVSGKARANAVTSGICGWQHHASKVSPRGARCLKPVAEVVAASTNAQADWFGDCAPRRWDARPHRSECRETGRCRLQPVRPGHPRPLSPSVRSTQYRQCPAAIRVGTIVAGCRHCSDAVDEFRLTDRLKDRIRDHPAGTLFRTR